VLRRRGRLERWGFPGAARLFELLGDGEEKFFLVGTTY
jgi:hypothetical protein